jgi:hypothetical protein
MYMLIANTVFQLVVHVHKKMTSCLKFFCKLADKLINNQEGIHMTRAAAEQDAGGGHGRRHHSNVYGQEDPSIQVRQGEAPQSGNVRHQGLQEAFYQCLQHVHARHSGHTEAVLVLQPHDRGGDQVFCQAYCLAPLAGERGWEQLG